MTKKKCPYLAIAYPTEPAEQYCMEEECGMYVEREKACSLVVNALGNFHHVWRSEK